MGLARLPNLIAELFFNNLNQNFHWKLSFKDKMYVKSIDITLTLLNTLGHMKLQTESTAFQTFPPFNT